MSKIKAILIGDVVGPLGCAMFQKHIAHLKEQYNADLVIVNGENSSAKGRGITSKIMHFFKHNHANIVTSGNHIWAEKEIYSYLENNKDLLRPANFPPGAIGTGVVEFNVNGVSVGVINLQGRVFMPQQVDDPFRAIDQALITLRSTRTNVIFVDMHAETTAEKMGVALYLDGRVSCVVGTHTHVQTADERILPKGTAFITDLGMSGALNSMIGMKKDNIIETMKTQMPTKFEVELQGPAVMSGVCVEVDADSGKAISIERIRVIDNDISAQ